MAKSIVIEKKHRLDPKLYTGLVCATFTLCIKNNTYIFTEENIVNIFVRFLNKTIEKYKIKNWVYVFMPNHLHIILEGQTENSDLLKCISLFKQLTGYWLSRTQAKACGYQNQNVEWQKDFYDHIHRKDDDLIKHIKYILDNPVRRRLVENWLDYPFKGSLNYKLEDIL